MERHIHRDGTSSCPISSSWSQGVPTLALLCKPYHQRRPIASGCVSLARLSILCLLSKSDHVVLITWSPSGYTAVGTDCQDVLPSPCLLISTWQLVKVHGVTRNEPKIHFIWYITGGGHEFCIGYYVFSNCFFLYRKWHSLLKIRVQELLLEDFFASGGIEVIMIIVVSIYLNKRRRKSSSPLTKPLWRLSFLEKLILKSKLESEAKVSILFTSVGVL